jgi:chromate reductase, NAD(P)H dehydrogenase (quinone)
MIRLLGISGSLRAASYNTALLRAAQSLTSPDVLVEIALLKRIPLYDGDVEQAEGVPLAVTALKRRVQACDGLLLASPEYNNSIPGVLKNAIDWLSRPPAELMAVFGGRPVAVMCATPGISSIASAQCHWLPVLRHLGALYWPGERMLVPGAHKAFNEQGELVDEDVRRQLASFLAGFADFARNAPGSAGAL